MTLSHTTPLKKVCNFNVPAGMSLTKLTLSGNNLIYSLPGRVWLVASRPGTVKLIAFFYSAAYVNNSTILLLCRSLKKNWRYHYVVVSIGAQTDAK
jgi:hypothetical protein